MKLDDLTGKKFGRLTVLERSTGAIPKHTYWLCECECGNKVIVAACHLKNGHTKSCGCYCHNKTTIHGQWKTRLYSIWRNMKNRCNNPNAPTYNRYGGRGISVCDEWQNDFVSFYEWSMANGYNDDLSIDRIDNDGCYCPDNCRWATKKEQSNNTSWNRIFTYNGESHTIPEWSEIKNISQRALRHRIERGWTLERALTQPMQKRKKKSS